MCDFHLEVQLKQKSTEILISDFSPVTTARMPGCPAGCTDAADMLSVALRDK